MSFHDRHWTVEVTRSSERAAWARAAMAEQALTREDDALTDARREVFRQLHAQWAEQADDLAELEEDALAFPEDREVEFTDWH